MQYLEILLNVPLEGSFTYTYDESGASGKTVSSGKAASGGTTSGAATSGRATKAAVGLRAEVPFGRRNCTGCIISVSDTLPQNLGFAPEKIKPIKRLVDKEPLFTQEQVELARWISRYYLCSWGEALSAMLPSGRRETEAPGFAFEEDASTFTRHELSAEQKAAIGGILGGGSLFHYLYGPTGSGKTEVFLGAAEAALAEGKGVIYLVPEIGLTHQVIEAVVARFGDTAAVLHSNLTGSQRLTEWRRIMHKEARVVIGARSAVFAPVPDLGLVIIDEEHDASYKSGNTPRYHARQVAMKRAMDGRIPLVMGSATPSLEAWRQMEKGQIAKHTLTARLAGGKEPEIRAVNLSEPGNTPQNGCLSPKLEEEIAKTLAEKRQTILFLNRRGYSHFFKCNSCGHELTCKNCSVSLTYHKAQNRFICHYCGYSLPFPTTCPECGSLDTSIGSFGTEFIEQETRTKFPAARIDRLDTDNLSDKDELKIKLARFRRGETDILLGTQMVAKGLNFPRLKLVGVVMGDSGLQLPDFRAAERTFSLIVQVAGRAGRFFPDGKVLVQSYNPARPAITFATQSDVAGFYQNELAMREALAFPPYTRLLRLVFRSAREETASGAAESAATILQELAKTLPAAQSAPIEILGPTECPLPQIQANHRRQILLRSPAIAPLQELVRTFTRNYRDPHGVYLEIDVDPVNLL